jgi:hypothetical protein
MLHTDVRPSFTVTFEQIEFVYGMDQNLHINNELPIEYVSPITHLPLAQKGDFLESGNGDERYPITERSSIISS